MVKFIISIATIFLLKCCTYPDPSNSIMREAFTSNNIRIDGYYYQTLYNFQGPIYPIYFLYKNGVIFRGGAAESLSKLDESAKFHADPVNKILNQNSDGWGVFKVNLESILLEVIWQGKSPPVKTLILKGNILNDTTFVMTSEFSNYTGKNRTINDTFYFKEFSPKPDSTNRYIK